jgi:hypothetical protein
VRDLAPVVVGVLLTAVVATMGTAANTLFNVYADTQVIRAEMVNASARIEKHAVRIDKLDERLNKLEALWPELRMHYKQHQVQMPLPRR